MKTFPLAGSAESLDPALSAELLERLRTQVMPALGCTEPAAVALAVARAREVLGCQPDRVVVRLSGNVLKNGMGVGIPGTGLIGLPVAVALAVVAGDPSRGLEVFSRVGAEDRDRALAWLETHPVEVVLAPDAPVLFIEAILQSGERRARVIIRDGHTHVVLVERDDEVLFSAQPLASKGANPVMGAVQTGFRDTIRFAETVDLENVRFMLDGVLSTRPSLGKAWNDRTGWRLADGWSILSKGYGAGMRFVRR